MQNNFLKREIEFSKIKYKELAFDFKKKEFILVDHRYKETRFDKLSPLTIEKEGLI